MACWRPLCPSRHSEARRAARWAAVWTLLAEQERQQIAMKNLERIKVNLGERIPERIVEQIVEPVVSSGEAGSSGPGADDATRAAATADGKLCW